MPVHETKSGYKYGETGKTYKNKKDAIKQAIAIAYSQAEKKGRKPTKEELKAHISGNPDEMSKTASAIAKIAARDRQTFGQLRQGYMEKPGFLGRLFGVAPKAKYSDLELEMKLGEQLADVFNTTKLSKKVPFDVGMGTVDIDLGNDPDSARVDKDALKRLALAFNSSYKSPADPDKARSVLVNSDFNPEAVLQGDNIYFRANRRPIGKAQKLKLLDDALAKARYVLTYQPAEFRFGD